MTDIYSHIFEDQRTKLLADHLREVGTLAREILRRKVLHFSVPQEAIVQLAYLIGITHDVGKATPYFQVERLQRGQKTRLTTHALLSACFGYSVMQPYLPEDLRLAGFYAIARHHTDLSSVTWLLKKMFARTGGFFDTLTTQRQCLSPAVWEMTFDGVTFESFQEGFQEIEPVLAAIETDAETVCAKASLETFLVLLLTFSALLEADKAYLVMAAEEYQREKAPVVLNPRSVEHYRQTIVKPGKMGAMRDQAAQEVRDAIARVELEHARIFSITLPTGTGKTLVSLDAALCLRERLRPALTPKIIYALPYLAIIEQTEGVFRTVFGNPSERVFSKQHSLAESRYHGQKGEEFDSDQAEFLLNIWNSEMILTTFDQLLYAAFSRDRAHLIRAHHLANSIIILDEVQALPPGLWTLIREFFKVLSRVGQTYIILMTATKPYIFEPATEILELVPQPAAYFQACTRTRLEAHLDQQMPLETFVAVVGETLAECPGASCLVVLNTIASAKEVFKRLKTDYPDRRMSYLSSQIVPKQRRTLIQRMKAELLAKEPLVLVSTQCIEAGVDVNFDKGFRDLGPLEAIIQVAGRLNREWNHAAGILDVYELARNGTPYWKSIYSEVLIGMTKEVLAGKRDVPEPEFAELIEQYYRKGRERMSTAASSDFLESLCQWQFTNDIRTALRGEEDTIPVFIVQDEESEAIFQEWQMILGLPDFRERHQKLMRIRGQIAENSISLRKNLVDQWAVQAQETYYLWYAHYTPEGGFDPNPQ